MASKVSSQTNIYLSLSIVLSSSKFVLKFLLATMIRKNFAPLSHTAFQALQRFSIVTEWLYYRPITWDRPMWQPRRTPRNKLTTWYFLSLIVSSIAIHFVFTLIRQILSYQKDPDISILMGIFLILAGAGYTVAVSVIFTEIFKIDEFRVMLKFLRKFEGIRY